MRWILFPAITAPKKIIAKRYLRKRKISPVQDIKMQKRLLLLFLLCFVIAFVSACQKTSSQPASAEAKRFSLKGKVISVDKVKKKAVISHEAIPGYMDAMTMEFPIREDWVMDELAPGSDIRAELVIDKGDFYLENIGIVALPNPDQPPLPVVNAAEKELIGKEVPDLKLTNQDGKRISLTQFRGKALALTFIYTRCPLPNYCPLMTIHFSEMAMSLQKMPELKDKVRLLSITFDPKHDTPEVLKTYGEGYYNKDVKPDFTLWQLATGSEDDIKKIAEFFGLSYQADPTDKTQIIHSLRTVVIDPQGKVKKVFAGNEWTNDEVMKELQNSLTSENK
jgi:protein SCO1/2